MVIQIRLVSALANSVVLDLMHRVVSWRIIRRSVHRLLSYLFLGFWCCCFTRVGLQVSTRLSYPSQFSPSCLLFNIRSGVPQGEDAEIRVRWYHKPLGGWIARHILGKKVPPSPFVAVGAPYNGNNLETSEDSSDKAMQQAEAIRIDDVVGDVHEAVFVEDNDPEVGLARQVSHLSARSFRPRRASGSRSSLSRLGVRAPPPLAFVQVPHSPAAFVTPSQTSHPLSSRVHVLCGVLEILAPLRVVITPITMTIAVSLPIALITPLKALFVDVSDVTDKYSSGSWRGPDGKPVLNFLIDTGGYPMDYGTSPPYQ
jgi:auxin efflux carrier family protein